MLKNKNKTSGKKSPRNKKSYILDEDSAFMIVEAYKKFRTNLQFVLSQSDKKSFIITSPMPDEGKSTVALNTGIVFSQLGKRVMIIDADMRKPTVYKKLGLTNHVGLSSVLGNFNDLSEAIKPFRENIDVITSGPIPPTPSEMLSSKRMDDILKRLEQAYDVIILDTPPINMVADALSLSDKVGGAVLVVRERSTKYEAVKKALAAIDDIGMKLFGTVINGSRNSIGKLGYRNRYYYSYNYAYKASPSNK